MRRTRWMPPTIATAVLLLSAAGCSSGPATAPARAAAGTPVRYVALGGDDVSGGRRNLTTSWPQVLFRDHFAVNATLINLASPRHGGAEIRSDEVPTAVRLQPDIVTITLLDDLERATPASEVQGDLTAIIDGLRTVDGVRILVGTAPPDTGTDAERSSFDAAVRTAARSGGAEIVDLHAISITDAKLRAQKIADAFARQIANHPRK